MNEEDITKIKEIVYDCIDSGQYLKAYIVPHEGEFHAMTQGEGMRRDVFTTREGACIWVSAYFMYASVAPGKAKEN